jgi:hypothetical protein
MAEIRITLDEASLAAAEAVIDEIVRCAADVEGALGSIGLFPARAGINRNICA